MHCNLTQNIGIRQQSIEDDYLQCQEVTYTKVDHAKLRFESHVEAKSVLSQFRTCHNYTVCICAPGVRQGCILSPFLFNLYADRIMRKAEMEEAKEAVKIAGRTLNNLRYADDTTLMAGKKADLAKLIRRLKRESEKAGLYFKIKKTKIMTTANWDSFEID